MLLVLPVDKKAVPTRFAEYQKPVGAVVEF
jgi:hypothetical protein